MNGDHTIIRAGDSIGGYNPWQAWADLLAEEKRIHPEDVRPFPVPAAFARRHPGVTKRI